MKALFDIVSKKISFSKIIVHLVLPGFMFFAASCIQKATQRTVENGDLAETAIHKLDTMLFSTPNTVEINRDSLVKKPANGKMVKIGKPGVIEYTGVQTRKASKLKIQNVLSDPVAVVPGSESIPYPETFKIWKMEGDTTMQNDTILRIRTTHAAQPDPVPAKAPQFKDNAACDLRYMDIEQGMASSYIWSLILEKRGKNFFGTSRG
jgi:hypothetical protein